MRVRSMRWSLRRILSWRVTRARDGSGIARRWKKARNPRNIESSRARHLSGKVSRKSKPGSKNDPPPNRMGIFDAFRKEEVTNSKVLVCQLGPNFEEFLKSDFRVYKRFYPGASSATFTTVAELR